MFHYCQIDCCQHNFKVQQWNLLSIEERFLGQLREAISSLQLCLYTSRGSSSQFTLCSQSRACPCDSLQALTFELFSFTKFQTSHNFTQTKRLPIITADWLFSCWLFSYFMRSKYQNNSKHKCQSLNASAISSESPVFATLNDIFPEATNFWHASPIWQWSGLYSKTGKSNKLKKMSVYITLNRKGGKKPNGFISNI